MIIELQRDGVVHLKDNYKHQFYLNQVEAGIIQHVMGAKSLKVFELTRRWEKVKVVDPDPEIQAVVKKHQEVLKRHGIVTDEPPVWERPPAEYSNRSQEQLIDHILKNY